MRPNTNHEYLEDVETPGHCRLCDERPSADCHDVGFVEYPETSLPTTTTETVARQHQSRMEAKPHVTKQDEVKVGQVWTAKVSEQVTEVRIDAVCRDRGFKGLNGYTRPAHTFYKATNLRTGKEVHIRSAAKLRRLVKDAEVY